METTTTTTTPQVGKKVAPMEAVKEESAGDFASSSAYQNVELGSNDARASSDPLDDNDDDNDDASQDHKNTTPQEEEIPAQTSFGMIRIWIILVHALFMAFSVLTHYIYDWSDDSDVTAWFSLTDESLVQHLKMILWPWLVVLVPLDILTKTCARYPAHEDDSASTWYLRNVTKASWLNLLQVNIASMTMAMLLVAGVYRLYTAIADVTDNLPADICLFIVAVTLCPVLRIWLMGQQEQVSGWLVLAILVYGLLWFFTYFSYEDNVQEEFWLDPHKDSVDHDVD